MYFYNGPPRLYRYTYYVLWELYYRYFLDVIHFYGACNSHNGPDDLPLHLYFSQNLFTEASFFNTERDHGLCKCFFTCDCQRGCYLLSSR